MKTSQIILISFFTAMLGLSAAIALDAFIHPNKPSFAPINFSQYKPDLELGFVHKANTYFSYQEKGRHLKEITVYYDKYGARVPSKKSISLTPSDIIAIGGSQTWGQGVLEQETFSGRLAKFLHAKVINLGVAAYGGVSALLQLRRYIHLFKPKYIVYGMWQDHINRNVKRCVEYENPFICEKRPMVALDQKKRPIIVPAGDNTNALKDTAEWYTTRNPTFWFNLRWTWKKFKWNFLKLIHRSPDNNPLQTVAGKQIANTLVLEKMASIAKQAHAKLIVVFIPFYFANNVDSMPNYLTKLAKDNHFTLINMKSAFLRMQKRHIHIAIPEDGHMSPQAHNTIAKAIYQKCSSLRLGSNLCFQ